MVEKVRQMWQQHEQMPVPVGFRGMVVDGLNLTILHCEVASNIITFIETGGRLGMHRVERLKSRQPTLERTVQTLQGPAKDYFASLKRISDLVVQTR